MTPNPNHGIVRRTLQAGASVLIAVAACGGPMSGNEYVAGLNDLVATAAPELDASLEAYEQIADPTTADWAAFVNREVAIRQALDDGFKALDPPHLVADVHELFKNAVDRGLAATEALAAVSDTVSSPEQAQQTPEFAEYQAANADGSGRVCLEALAKLDDLAKRGVALAGEPWISSLGLTVRTAFGCGSAATG